MSSVWNIVTLVPVVEQPVLGAAEPAEAGQMVVLASLLAHDHPLGNLVALGGHVPPLEDTVIMGTVHMGGRWCTNLDVERLLLDAARRRSGPAAVRALLATTPEMLTGARGWGAVRDLPAFKRLMPREASASASASASVSASAAAAPAPVRTSVGRGADEPGSTTGAGTSAAAGAGKASRTGGAH